MNTQSNLRPAPPSNLLPPIEDPIIATPGKASTEQTSGKPQQVIRNRKSLLPLWISLIAGIGGSSLLFVLLIAAMIVIGASSRPQPSYSYGYDNYGYGNGAYQSGAYQSDAYSDWNGQYGGQGRYSEFQGEMEFGGMPYTSGTFDNSGEGNDVIMLDGEVLNLPPY